MLKLLEIASAEVGYLEKASNNNLDDKTANAGSGNYTKYARDLDNITGFYNGRKNGYAWCDIFVDWCFVKAYGAEKAKKMLFQPDNSAGAGCTYSAQYYKNNGRFTDVPQIGAQIFFGNASESTHTGIVYKVENYTVYTIEGNTSGASGVIANGGGVCKKSYSRSYNGIYGYGLPNYDLVESESADTTSEIPSTTTKDVCNVELNVLRVNAIGNEVKSTQLLLIGNGFSCGKWGADGEFGSGTLAAVKAFQKAKGLTVDGIVGKNTWSKLLRG